MKLPPWPSPQPSPAGWAVGRGKGDKSVWWSGLHPGLPLFREHDYQDNHSISSSSANRGAISAASLFLERICCLLALPPSGLDGAPLMSEQKNFLVSSSLPKNARKRQLPCLLINGIAVAVLLGLALGLGLGLGLKHSSKTSAPPPSVVANSSSATPPNSYASPNLTSLRLATRDYSLDMADWDIAAPPTTRVYNFTLG